SAVIVCASHNFFFSSRRRHTRSDRDWSSDVCSSDLFLTDRHVGLSLEDVHFERTDSAEIGQEVNVRIIARVPGRALEPQPALRIVAGHRGEQQELHLRNLLLHEPVRIDDAERIFPWIEAANLADYVPVEIDVEPRDRKSTR